MTYERREPTLAQMDYIRALMAKADHDMDGFKMENVEKMTRSQVQQIIDRLVVETRGADDIETI